MEVLHKGDEIMTEKKNSNFQDSDDDIVLDRSETFVATESDGEPVDNDESSFMASEKPVEYIENLMEAELTRAEAEAEAELKKEAKRKKDRAKAREKDKKAMEEANKKHEQDLAREKERLINQERTRSESHQFEPLSEPVHFTTPTNDFAPSVDNENNTPNDIQGSYNSERAQNLSSSEFPNEYSERKYKERRDALHEEILEQQKFEKEQTETFFEKIQQNAYERQRASEQYQSFGNEGIDYSGNDRHSAYIRVGEETVITEPVYQSIREDYEKSKAEFKSYGSHVPESVMEQYRLSSELYFSTERRIHEGSLLVKPETDVLLDTRKTDGTEFTAGYNYVRVDNTSTPFVAPDPQENQNYHYNENSDTTSSNSFVFCSSRQDMSRRAYEVLAQVQSNETYEQPKNNFPCISKNEGVSAHFVSEVYQLSQERYDSLKTKYKASMAEIDSYEGRDIPVSVLRRNEQINKVYSAIKEKVESGEVAVVGVGADATSHPGGHIKNGNSIKPASNRNPNVVLGSQVISEINRHNYSAKNVRTGDGHRKPPKTPLQSSPLSKYDKLKIYHSRNYFVPFERGTRGAVGALGCAVVYAARSEQSGAVNTMVSTHQRSRDVVNTLKVLNESPRTIAAAYYVTKDAALTARNAVRFFEGKEALAHKSHRPLTVKQLNKQFKNPFAGAEKSKITKKFGSNATLADSQINRNLVIKTSQNRFLKNEIKRLQSKGTALSAEDRKTLKELIDKKKASDVNLRKLHGLKKARTEAMRLNREVDRLSEKAAKKTIKKTSKKGLKLSKKDKAVLARLQDRKNLLNKRDKLLKAKNARKQLTTSLSTIITRVAGESEDSTVQSILNADRVLQNRYVRSILKFSAKATLLPLVPVKKVAGVGWKKFDKKYGVSNCVNTVGNTIKEKTVDVVFNSRVYRGLNGGLYNHLKKRIIKHTPIKIKTQVSQIDNVVSNLNAKRKAVLDKFKALKTRLASSRVGRVVSSVRKGIGGIFDAFSVAKKILYKIGLYCASFFIIVAMVGAAISSSGAAVSSLVLSDSNVSDDGKIDLSDYYSIIIDEWDVYIQELNAQGLSEGAEKIVVNMDSVPSNGREILSMMAVRMSQDLNLDNNGDIEPYLRYLVRQLNPFYSEVSYYSCSGCKTKTTYCSDEDCKGHKEKYCPGTHKMISFFVTPSCFGSQEELNDPLFSADEMGNDGQEAITGGLIGKFTVTYYCLEEFDTFSDGSNHLCNAGPPYVTATGTKVTPGRTIAVDPSVIPLGSHVIIDGHEYIAEDTGGRIQGNRIDIGVATHSEAKSKGTRNNVAVYAVGYEGEDIDTAGEWQGWNEGNIEWAKNIYYQDWSEIYSGLPAGTAGGGGSTDLSGVKFVNGERPGNDEIVNIGKAEEGVSGRPNKYTYWYGKIGNTYSYHWCAAFVSWCAKQAGETGAVGKFAYCPSWADDFSRKGQWARPGDITPVAGDIIFFDWEVDGITDHVGIVVGSDGSKVYTVEGNSGDRVKIKSYSLNYRSIYGYGLPNY